MEGNLAFDHILLAPANLHHVRLDGASHRAELRGVLGQMRNSRAPELIFAGQTGDRGTRASDPSALYDGNLLPGVSQMPSEQLAPLAASEDHGIEALFFRHDLYSLQNCWLGICNRSPRICFSEIDHLAAGAVVPGIREQSRGMGSLLRLER
jgi:hypothetical protein